MSAVSPSGSNAPLPVSMSISRTTRQNAPSDARARLANRVQELVSASGASSMDSSSTHRGRLLTLLTQLQSELTDNPTALSKKTVKALRRQLTELRTQAEALPSAATDGTPQRISHLARQLQNQLTTISQHQQVIEGAAAAGAAQAARSRAQARLTTHQRQLEELRNQAELLSRTMNHVNEAIALLESQIAAPTSSIPRAFEPFQLPLLRIEKQWIEGRLARIRAALQTQRTPAALIRHGEVTQRIVAIDRQAAAILKEGAAHPDTVANNSAHVLGISGVTVQSAPATVAATVQDRGGGTLRQGVTGTVQPFLRHAINLETLLKVFPRAFEAICRNLDPLNYQRNVLYATLTGDRDLHTENIMIEAVTNEGFRRLEGKSWEYEISPNEWMPITLSDIILRQLNGTITPTTRIREYQAPFKIPLESQLASLRDIPPSDPNYSQATLMIDFYTVMNSSSDPHQDAARARLEAKSWQYYDNNSSEWVTATLAEVIQLQQQNRTTLLKIREEPATITLPREEQMPQLQEQLQRLEEQPPSTPAAKRVAEHLQLQYDMGSAMRVSWEARQIDNTQIYNLEQRGGYHTGDQNDYQLNHNRKTVIPCRSCLLGTTQATNPMSAEFREELRALQSRQRSYREYLTQGDHQLWRQLRPATRQNLLTYFRSAEFRSQLRYLENETVQSQLLDRLPRDLLQQVLVDLTIVSLQTPVPLQDASPEARTQELRRLAIQEQLDTIQSRLPLLKASLNLTDPGASIAFDAAARRLTRQLRHFIRSEHSCSELTQQAIETLTAIWGSSMHSGAILPPDATALMQEMSSAAAQMDRQVAASPELQTYRENLALLRSGHLQQLSQRISSQMPYLATHLFPPIAPIAAAAAENRLVKTGQYLDLCENQVARCNQLLVSLRAEVDQPVRTAGSNDRIAALMNQAQAVIESNGGVTRDIPKRFKSECRAILESLPPPPAPLTLAQQTALINIMTKAARFVEPTPLGMHFFIYPKMKIMIEIMTAIFVQQDCRNRRLPLPTDDAPASAELYTRVRNSILLETRLLRDQFYCHIPCADILEDAQNASVISDNEYSELASEIASIESAAI